MDEYLKILEDKERQIMVLESQMPTLETQWQINKLNSEVRFICAKCLQELETHHEDSLSALKAQESDLRRLLFYLRLRQAYVSKNPESTDCLQNTKQIKVVRREIARIKIDILERGKIK